MIKVYQKVILVVLILIGMMLGIYFRFFKRPPLDQILAANVVFSDVEHEMYDYIESKESGEEPVMDEVMRSKIRWEIWVRAMNYVSIGTLFNKCNDTRKVTLGKVILMEDQVRGGLKLRTYLNVTFDKDITAGRIFLACQYNGNDIYSKDWDLCTLEKEIKPEDRIINCPVSKGKRRFVKDLKIPNYLPKGHFIARAWVVDQHNMEIGCGFADFQI
ncbi:hypothetical protein HELRODRAFT_168855 [Helobdella robusta]|uniref:MD-2-related lipid-recognition domain-containing protein n=1 Tax=Helobdella robusta TaxID=6412 RepID=T1F117_HELRO|nr:hypothetical protein HELRODRAFT_168855 [Helobdella robusta]ESO08934.1 hypothetical protein HELRODRAFT_168855 [Helobdella robusta]